VKLQQGRLAVTLNRPPGGLQHLGNLRRGPAVVDGQADDVASYLVAMPKLTLIASRLDRRGSLRQFAASALNIIICDRRPRAH
jgi:hypothetical protein